MSSHTPAITPFEADILESSYPISICTCKTFEIDSGSVFLTVTEVLKDQKSLLEGDEKSFALARRGEIDLLLKDAVTPIFFTEVPENVALQVTKWVLAMKIFSRDLSTTRHRASLVSTSQKTALRHSVN